MSDLTLILYRFFRFASLTNTHFLCIVGFELFFSMSNHNLSRAFLVLGLRVTVSVDVAAPTLTSGHQNIFVLNKNIFVS